MTARILKRMAVVALAATLGGCAMAAAPVNGWFMDGVKGPMSVTAADASTKTGEAECSTICGIYATGDASIETAAKNGGITKIHHVDYQSTNFFGFYAKFKTIVHGS